MSEQILKRNLDLSIEELVKQNAQLKVENKDFYKQVSKIDSKTAGWLRLLWFVPILGWVIYNALMAGRKANPKYLNQVLPIKEQIAKNEFQVIYNEKLIEDKK
ncbi:hypothetical protein [Mesoplasma coleopterae]|uniref:hypothetical protein n=1 Tax=Mesoplasma coleopterae TaxID=324078 RepID=UPI000D041E90|nr:hypothetical protein [Mesoplasma coleopterae]AVN62364.1 hypothetical protein CG001_01735 [Mesoplasma coleopterae]AVN63052.1 hypothetical protein CG000_01895 [Mesoplasma coleopterae]